MRAFHPWKTNHVTQAYINPERTTSIEMRERKLAVLNRQKEAHKNAIVLVRIERRFRRLMFYPPELRARFSMVASGFLGATAPAAETKCPDCVSTEEPLCPAGVSVMVLFVFGGK
jgi:hypothetical protein